MTTKSVIKNLLPPIFLKLVQPKRKVVQQTYSSYDEALMHCNNPKGYEDNDIVKVVLEKTKRFKEKLENEKFQEVDATTAYGMLAIRQALGNKKEISVLDFGGACGAHYFTFKNLLGDDYKLNWAVVETSAMVQYAKSLENNELRFYDNLQSAANSLKVVNLAFSSGTLQYSPNPSKSLIQLSDLQAEHLFLNRLSLNLNSEDLITVQETLLKEQGVGLMPSTLQDKKVYYPHTNMSEQSLNNILAKRYALVMKFNDYSGIHIVANNRVTGYGLLLKKS